MDSALSDGENGSPRVRRIKVEFVSPFIDPKCVTRGRLIGTGGEGKVLIGTYRLSEQTELTVALKRFTVAKTEAAAAQIQGGGTLCDQKKLEHEIRLMTELKHPNILQCFGIFFEEDEFSPETPIVNVLLEYCFGGDLSHWLQLNAQLSVLRKVSILLQIARGLGHMHERKIIHSDVSLDNVLVTTEEKETAVMKVSDFGLSNHYGTVVSADIKGKPRYMPPSREGDKTKIDVYAYGILSWEIWNGGTKAYSREGLDGLVDPLIFFKTVHERHLRPKIGACVGMPPELRDLVVSCWSERETDRPSFGEIVSELSELVHRIEVHGEGVFSEQQHQQQEEQKEEEEEEEEEGEQVPVADSVSAEKEKWLDEIISSGILNVPEELREEVRAIVFASPSQSDAVGATFAFLSQRKQE